MGACRGRALPQAHRVSAHLSGSPSQSRCFGPVAVRACGPRALPQLDGGLCSQVLHPNHGVFAPEAVAAYAHNASPLAKGPGEGLAKDFPEG